MEKKPVYEDIELDFFDVQEYLDDRGVIWASEGKNISPGWIGMNCPFCRDASNHFGVNMETMKISCWKCKKKGTVLNLIMAIDNCSFKRAITTLPKYVRTNFAHLVKKIRTPSEKVLFPSCTNEKLLPIHEKFIIGRGYDPIKIQRKYDVLGVGPTLDDWKFRLIIPVYMKGELVTYVGRDTTGKLEVPYKNAPIEKSVLQAKHCLYNIDSVKDTAVAMEGLLDVWRFGDGGICTFGTQFTTEQLILLKGIRRLFILFDGREEDDGEAITHAHKMANEVSCIVPEVEVLELSDGDPDKMTDDEIWELRRDIGMNIA
jgi:DNA primase